MGLQAAERQCLPHTGLHDGLGKRELLLINTEARSLDNQRQSNGEGLRAGVSVCQREIARWEEIPFGKFPVLPSSVITSVLLSSSALQETQDLHG